MRFESFRRTGKLIAKGVWYLPRTPLKSDAGISLAFGCVVLSMAQGAFAQSAVSVRSIDVAHYQSYLPETHSIRSALQLFTEAAQAKRNGPFVNG